MPDILEDEQYDSSQISNGHFLTTGDFLTLTTPGTPDDMWLNIAPQYSNNHPSEIWQGSGS